MRDRPADVEDRRTTETEVRKQHGFAALLEQLVLARNEPRRSRPEGSALSGSEPSPPRRGAAPGPVSGRRSCGRTAARSHSHRRSCRNPGTTRPRRQRSRAVHVTVESGSLTLKQKSPPGSPSVRSISSTGLWQRRLAPDRSSRRTSASSTSVARSETGKILPLPSILVATPASSNIRTVASTSNRRNDGPRNAPLSPNACWMARMPRDCARS